MSRILAFPFRLTGGEAATVEEQSAAGIAQAIALLLLTELGERPLVPTFGIADPAFVGLDVAAVNSTLALHLPGVAVTGLTVDAVDATRERVRVTYLPSAGTGE